MSVKKTNDFLLISLIVGVIFDLGLANLSVFENTGWDLLGVIKYLTIALIGIIIIKRNGESVLEYLPYNVPMKLKTALLIIPLTICILPLGEALSTLGGLLFGEDYQIIATQYVAINESVSLPEMIFTTAVIPAVFEEMLFRGFFYQGYRKGKGARTAILLTSLLFGAFHMIGQQAFYAAAIGIILAVIRQLTGSMWPGMWLHFLNNGYGVLEIKLMEAMPGAEKYFPDTYLTYATKRGAILTSIAAAVSVFLITLILRQIAKTEGEEDSFKNFFKEESTDSGEKLITASLVIVLLIEFGVMFAVGSVIEFIQQTGTMT